VFLIFPLFFLTIFGSRSSLVYTQHRGEVLDVAPVENSHSIASVSTDGRVHVWRVDMAGQSNGGPVLSTNQAAGAMVPPSSSAYDNFMDDYTVSSGNISVQGFSQVRVLDPSEGPAVCVGHFNSDVCSVVTYATQRGGMHGWDLRAAREAMHLPVRPELGYTTCMTVSPDRNWVCLGTSKGFISLFDIRYNVPSKLWRHSSYSSIHRLACCKAPKSAGTMTASAGVPQAEGAFLFVAAGQNEAGVWGVPEGGECCKCFRSVLLDESRGPVAPLPVLEEVAIPSHPHAPITYAEFNCSFRKKTPGVKEESVRAIIGRISQSNMSYVVTAGTDRSIRFWDFSSASRCFNVSGLDAAQPKAIFDTPKLNDGVAGKLCVCYVAATPSADKILQMHLPVREGRGVVLPSSSTKVSC
jgi:phosphoinositide-3-kinase, regulatory subunit 4